MTTYRDEALTDGDTTRWLYDEPSGCMTNKIYADGKGPSYSYTPDGKLARRVWARGIATDYTYDTAGNLTRTEYDDNGVTPTITMSYDRVGNLINATTAGVVTNLYAYDLQGHCTNEWQNDFNLTRYYDTLGRNTGYAINGTRQTTIAYDTYGRIGSMSLGLADVSSAQNANDEFTWTYLPGSDLKASLQYPNGLTASWQYDANNQLLQVRNATPTNVVSQFDYAYDAAGRRVSIAKSGSAFGDLSGSVDAYTYNARSELTSARRTKNGQPIPGFSEDFDYDPIGNRRSSATYNEKGEAQTSTYAANNLNQYTSRTTPGYAAVRGEADPNAMVTVNENATFRLGSYYFGSDLFDNSSSGGLANLETYATLAQTVANGDETDDLISSETNQVYIAQSPESFAYDDDGNQTLITTKAGLWRVTYNGENRPILWVRDSDNTTLTMSYDHMGRRRVKNDQRFFYDGYLQIANHHSTTTTSNYNYFVWDCTEIVATRPLAWLRADFSGFYTHDGNKNVSEVITMNDGLVAHYEYAPFGAIIALCGERVGANPWRFSSEFADDELGCDYYNYREYEPVTGRWMQRDPMSSIESANLYCWILNRSSGVDILGLWRKKEGASSVWIAEKGDSLRGLARKVSQSESDWSCLWPVGNTTDHGYPDTIWPCDEYSSENLDATSGGVLTIALQAGLGIYDHLSGAITLAANLVPARIRDSSGEGGTPIHQLLVGGHGGVETHDLNDNLLSSYSVSDIIQLGQPPSFSRASQKKGPCRCWFTRTASVRISGCSTMSVAQQFATELLRAGAISYGTDRSIGTSIDGNGNLMLYYDYDAHNANPAHSSEYYSSIVWKSFGGQL